MHSRCVELQARAVAQVGSPRIQFDVEDPEQAKLVASLFVQENARRGLILSTGFFFNCGHDDGAALDHTERVVTESFGILAEGLQRGDLASRLDSQLQEESFRRLVR